MPTMEISIKWNVCRVCLAEEQQHHPKYILIDSKMAKQIYDIAGVQMNNSDNLPDKICRKCVLLLKYACHFSQTCRSSEEYLQSVIQKTKSATSMLKMDKRREHSVELLEEIFKEDAELISANKDEALHDSTMDDDLKINKDKLINSPVLAEKIGDGGDDKEICPTKLMRAIPRTTTAFNMQQSQRTQHVKTTTKFFVMKDNDKVGGATFNNKLNKINRDVENFEHEFSYDDHEENELDGFDDSKTNNKEEALLVSKSNSECSMDMDYINDDAQKQEDTNECSLNNEEDSNVNETDNTLGVEKNTENEKILPNSDDEQEQETDELFYIIEEPVIKEEDSIIQQNVHVEADVEVEPNLDVEENADAESESTMQLIEDLTEADGCDEGEEPGYERSETNRSVVQMEEYLIDESDIGSVAQQELESSEQLASNRPSTATIKIRDREQRSSPHIRRKANFSLMFSCDVCGNHFTNRSLRNYHMRIHRQEKNFECELCFKRFTAACNLTAHMRIHTGEKPYECQYCFRRFTDRSTHVKHERVHTNEKP
ncbi:zinc finger protein 3-like, partial [Rhagoletis pomonella]|uniref:zinc finger protein 3-like n=1 Tax=Rhagoletis pomonella TaxID=28610 RepID=UPI001780307F